MGSSNYKKYLYDGPVMYFEKCVAHRWTATTYAPSEKKARSNFIFQFTKVNNRLPNTKITLPGRIILADGKESA